MVFPYQKIIEYLYTRMLTSNDLGTIRFLSLIKYNSPEEGPRFKCLAMRHFGIV